MKEETRLWLIKVLDSWRTTWEGLDGEDTLDIDIVIAKLEINKTLSIQDHELILFHLWQRSENA
jgi:hypothetical protein